MIRSYEICLLDSRVGGNDNKGQGNDNKEQGNDGKRRRRNDNKGHKNDKEIKVTTSWLMRRGTGVITRGSKVIK